MCLKLFYHRIVTLNKNNLIIHSFNGTWHYRYWPSQCVFGRGTDSHGWQLYCMIAACLFICFCYYIIFSALMSIYLLKQKLFLYIYYNGFLTWDIANRMLRARTRYNYQCYVNAPIIVNTTQIKYPIIIWPELILVTTIWHNISNKTMLCVWKICKCNT